MSPEEIAKAYIKYSDECLLNNEKPHIIGTFCEEILKIKMIAGSYTPIIFFLKSENFQPVRTPNGKRYWVRHTDPFKVKVWKAAQQKT